jgi:hypothetical protein
VFDRAVAHLEQRPEQVGFFLAVADADARTFDLREWRGVPDDGLAYRSDVHVELAEHAQTAAIKWAWESGLALVEVHSHRCGPAQFSGADFVGFDDWVPHVRWRLRGRPYAALVSAGETLDGLAWVEDDAELVERIELDDGEIRSTTGRSLRR